MPPGWVVVLWLDCTQGFETKFRPVEKVVLGGNKRDRLPTGEEVVDRSLPEAKGEMKWSQNAFLQQ